VDTYVFAEWHLRRAGSDYNIDVDGHWYNVRVRRSRGAPHRPHVEIFAKGERIAAHMRSSGKHKHTTVSDHKPSSHRRYADWIIERIRRGAATIGAATAALCDLILERRPHPDQGFRTCNGILRLDRPLAHL
jgi:transposase